MPQATVNGDTIHYTDRGSGLPLVLIHGFPLDQRIWAAQADALSSTARVLTIDLPGFGQSPSPRPFAMDSMADILHKLLAQIGALPCILGGLSMGGYIALAFVTRYPAGLKGLILADTRCEADTVEGKSARMKMIDAVRAGGSKAIADQMQPKMMKEDHSSPEIAAQLRQIMESCPPLTIEHALLAMRDRPDYRGELPSIAVPTLIIVGDCDAITPPSVAPAALQKEIPHATLVVVKDAGHLSSMEQPQQVTDAIRSFLATIPV